MTKKKHEVVAELSPEEKESEKLREDASKHYEETMAKVKEEGEEKVEPPPEAASHEGTGVYTVTQDVNIKHQDYKAGDTVYLTYGEYQTLRGLEVYCVPVESEPSPTPVV
jgi:hypothetical protein